MRNEVEVIASRFHAGLAFGHLIGLWFNLRNKRYGHAAVHAAFLAYDSWSAFSHAVDADGRYQTIREWRDGGA